MTDESILDSHSNDEDLIDIEGLDKVNYAVKLESISRIYKLGKREIRALSDLSVAVLPGEYVVVSGHSGSGKTTLLNIIGCIDQATSGRVFVLDVPIEDYDESFRATFRLTNLGYIFQSYNLVSTLTALENVMFPMQLSEKNRAELETDALHHLERVGLEERKNHLPWQLSSGEQQRVAIARAVVNDPAIILADEPTANLDEESATMVRTLLKELNETGKTLIVMTHDSEIINTPNIRHLKMAKGVLISDE